MKKIVLSSFFFVLLFGLMLVSTGYVRATNDVSRTSGASIILPADNSSYSLDTNTTVQSFTVNNSSIAFVVEGNSIINLSATGQVFFSVSNNTECSFNQACSGSNSSMSLSCPGSASQRTLTITPSALSSCGGGGGSSGVVYVPPSSGGGAATPATPAVPATPATTSTPATPATPAVPAVPAVTTVFAPEVTASPVVSNESSKVVITLPTVASFQPGTPLKFSFQYKNEGSKSVKVKIVRQLVNNAGKVVKTVSLSKAIKAGNFFTNIVNEIFSKSLPAGDYTVKVKVLDAKNNVLEENSFNVNVEKLKHKYFVLGADFPTATDVAFDEAIWNKIKSNVVLPANFKFKYSYINPTTKKQTIRMVREFIGPDGKVIAKSTGKWFMTVGEKSSQTVTQAVADNLGAGNYIVRITAQDWTSGEVFAQNQFGFTVEFK